MGSLLNSYGVTKDRKIYGNWQVQSPDGKLMFRCNEKKVKWYLNRKLAEIIDNKSLVIRLNFQPNGLGNHNKNFGLSEMKNQCVCCGTNEFLTRHHIIPYCYRRYFPKKLKDHNFHDVLLLCVNCHDLYERLADKLKMELSIKYNSPLNGEIEDRRDFIKWSKLASTLISDVEAIPKVRVNQIKSEVKTFFGIKRLTKRKLEKISMIKSTIIKKTHGESVIENIDDLNLFIKMWRVHFVKNLDCKFLPENWNIDNEF